MALIAEAVDAQGVPETLGVARTVSDPDHVEAEFAIIVRSDLKGGGLGTLLLGRLIEHARSRGIGRLVGIVLRENTRMLKLARALGFKTDPAVHLVVGSTAASSCRWTAPLAIERPQSKTLRWIRTRTAPGADRAMTVNATPHPLDHCPGGGARASQTKAALLWKECA